MTKSRIKSQKLKNEEFNKLIEYGTLISIDLVIVNDKNQILLGLRKNKPAKNFWFVPGGRILKHESKEQAFKRICKKELNINLDINDATLIDVYNHLYLNDNSNDIPNVDTHYIVLAYYTNIPIDINKLPKKQHKDYKWLSHDKESTDKIHKNVYPYFDITIHGNININQINENQYTLLNSRRDSFNTLVWQTPVTSLTAQAFLFIIALGSQVNDISKLIAAFLAFIAAIASIQLLMKHRAMESFHAITLHKYEQIKGLTCINDKIKNGNQNLVNKIQNISSYRIWIGLLLTFSFISLLIMINIIFPEIVTDIQRFLDRLICN